MFALSAPVQIQYAQINNDEYLSAIPQYGAIFTSAKPLEVSAKYRSMVNQRLHWN